MANKSSKKQKEKKKAASEGTMHLKRDKVDGP